MVLDVLATTVALLLITDSLRFLIMGIKKKRKVTNQAYIFYQGGNKDSINKMKI